MKTTFLKTIAAAMMLVFLCGMYSCKKTTTPPPANPTPGTLTATVNGTTFTTPAYAQILVPGRLDIYPGVSTTDSLLVSIFIAGTSTGTYTLNSTQGSLQNGNEGEFYHSNATNTSFTEYWTDTTHTGTVTITKWDMTAKQFSGTFSFNAVQFHPSATGATVSVSGSFTNALLQ